MDSALEALLRELTLSEGFVSGEILAKVLGVSRATVSRLARRLVEEGYPIVAHPKLGYRLAAGDDLSMANRYASALKTSLALNVFYLESCTSTQDVAAALAEAGAGEGTVVVAEEQASGRGRLGRGWASPRGGLWFTILLRPVGLGLSHLLSMAAGLAVAKALRGLFGIDSKLKWPNDVLVGGRKVAGILVEGSAEADRLRYILVGIGINVNNELPSPLRESAVSLRELLGQPVPRVPILLRVLKEIDALYNRLRSEDSSGILNEWRDLSATLGKTVRVIAHDGVYEGLAVDLDSDGGLVVDIDGHRVTFHAGDVVHLR